MNSKRDKIELLKAIHTGKIAPTELPGDPVIISEAKECFAGVMTAAACRKSGNADRIVFVGDAAQAAHRTMESVRNILDRRTQKRKSDEN